MSEKIRDSFIFYRSFYQSAKRLPKEDKAELFDAICSYALDGESMDLSVVPEAIFTVIKPNLDANRRRWENGCKEKAKDSNNEAKDEQEISKLEAEDKQTRSRSEGNKDKDVNVDVNKNKDEELQFKEFWDAYKNIHVSKGHKEKSKELFIRSLKKSTYEEIKFGLDEYIKYCHLNKIYTKQVLKWLKDETWKEYEGYKDEASGKIVTMEISIGQDELSVFLNKEICKQLFVKIVKSQEDPDVALIYFQNGLGLDKYSLLPEETKAKIKSKIGKELSVTKFKPKY